jgi:creatinine amidohydrolase/Fe(II)-dependent formamide hydrolase-like protein
MIFPVVHAANFAPGTIGLEQDFVYLRAEGHAVGFGWQTQDLHPAGACGDATDADAGRGAGCREALGYVRPRGILPRRIAWHVVPE